MPPPSIPRKRITLDALDALKAARVPIVVVTACDAPTAGAANAAGVDCILVGDSLGMAALGLASTVPVTMADMERVCGAVARGAGGDPGRGLSTRPLLVGDLPFGTYATVHAAVDAANRLVVAGGVAAVKLEGGVAQVPKVVALSSEGLPVWGHVGLLPQTAALGGTYAPRARSLTAALAVISDALALQEAGARAIVFECVPPAVAAFASSLLRIPIIGIGAGGGCDGQVLVAADLLGWTHKPPTFAKVYARSAGDARIAFDAYVADVRGRAFPAERHARAWDGEEAAAFGEAAERRFGLGLGSGPKLGDENGGGAKHHKNHVIPHTIIKAGPANVGVGAALASLTPAHTPPPESPLSVQEPSPLI